MKKGFLVLVLGLALILGGCSTLMNAVNSAQGLLCNPSDQQKADAAAAIVAANGLVAVLSVIPVTASVTALITGLGGAQAIFQTVQAGGCVALTALAQALDTLDQADAAQKVMAPASAKAMAKAMVQPVIVPPLTSLRNAL